MQNINISLAFEQDCEGSWDAEELRWRFCTRGTISEDGKKCPNCNGTGQGPTELGRAVLDFLRNQGHI